MHYAIARACAAIGLSMLLPISINAQVTEPEIPGITTIVRKHFPAGSKGGLALLVIKDNDVVYRKGYGSKFGKTSITPKSQLPLASISKQFAAMCAAILIEEKKLKLTDKVSKFLPDLKLQKEGRELLVQDLIWHINGLPNFINSKEKDSIERYKKTHNLKRLSNKTHAEWLATMPMRRPPGIQFEYTNSGYVLLARIIEIAADMPFHKFQQQRIFDVLKMASTTDSPRFNGSGNMNTTLEDYAKWDRALWNNTLLKKDTSGLLFQSGTLDKGEAVGYGFGWHVEYEDNELQKVWHGGAGSPKSSARNIVIRDIKNRITVALFVRENLEFTRAHRMSVGNEILNYARQN